jgi:hypothetical protein
MTIAKPPRSRPGAMTENSFVAAAPDAKATRWQRGNRTQITLSIAPELLEQVDILARAQHLSRAALLTVWINDRLKIERRETAA